MRKIKEKNTGNARLEYIVIMLIILGSFLMITHEFGLNAIMATITAFFMIINTLCYFKNDSYEKMIDIGIKYRYPILLCIFIICVFFKLSGSSIGVYNRTLTEKTDDKIISNLFGTSREVRGDEYTVLTPYYMSQQYNHFNKYSTAMSLAGQNMIIGYNAPLYDITTLAKPLNFGYILLGNEYGLSWYWCLKLLLIFLSAFEMFYIITKKNKILSLLGAFMIAWGPSTQWWFAPHMPDVILWAMWLFVCAYHFFASEKDWIRNILTIILPFVALEFVIALFPSFQVGLGYFILFVFLALLYRDKVKLFASKQQNIRNVIMVVCILGLLGYFLGTNYQDLKAVSNTVYPGHRVVTGGDYTLKDTFTDLSTLFLGYTVKAPYTNASEDSTYIHFGIFFLLLAPLLIQKLRKEKNRNWVVGASIASFMGIQLIFMLFGFPEFLAKITFFSYINRMKMIFGLVAIVFTIWGIDAFFSTKEKISKSYYILATFVFCLFHFSFIDESLKVYLPTYYYYIEIAIFALILVCLYWNYKRISYSLILALVLVASIPINPITVGVSDIYNHPSASKITQLAKENQDSYWIGYGNFVLPSYLLANGAKAFNAVNFYPDMKKWEILDPNKEYVDIYNRYCHIFTILSNDGKNHILSTNSADIIKLELTLEKMNELKIKYILANVDLTYYKQEKNFNLETIYKDQDVSIYEIVQTNKKVGKV